jgi:nitric oxide reductase NorQ protein
MAAKWNAEDLQVGLEMEATFWPNPVTGSGFRYRATHLDGLRAPKEPRVLRGDARQLDPGRPQARRAMELERELARKHGLPCTGGPFTLAKREKESRPVSR